ncbi:MAG: amidohydrolase [Phycisphaerales bacterium]
MPLRRIDNAHVLTLDRDRPATARSIELRDGRIVSVAGTGADAPPDDGSARGSPSAAPPSRPIVCTGDVLDVGGRTVVPGFIDAHLHLLLGGLALSRLDLSGARSRAEFERLVAERHAALPEGAWLEGAGWSEENWAAKNEGGHDGRDGALPDASWLRACGDRPAVLYRMDRHACLVNRAVLRRIDTRVDPRGGRIVRDASGAPTGVLQEAAAWQLVDPLVPKPDLAGKRRALAGACERLLRLGVTTAMSMELAAEVRDVLEPVRRRLAPRVLVTLLDREWPLDLSFATRFANDDRLRLLGCKAFIDGTLGSRTARMLEPYVDLAPGADPRRREDDGRGVLVELAERGVLLDWARMVVAAGLSPSMHAIGDEALRLALDVADALPRDARVRIEHAQTAHPRDVARTRGRWLSMQPLHKADDGRDAQARLGAERMDRFFPFRRYLDAGARLAFGSDWPIVSPDPLLGMRAAITALTLDETVVGGDQALTPPEALRAYTCDAAEMLGLRDVGAIRRGFAADLVVLSRDPFSADWALDPPRVDATIVAGELRHLT